MIIGILYLEGLKKSTEGIALPTTINGCVKLTNLESLDGIIIDDNFQCDEKICYQGVEYTTDEFKQKAKNENIMNNEDTRRKKINKSVFR